MAFSPRSKEGKACTFQESDGLKLNLRKKKTIKLKACPSHSKAYGSNTGRRGETLGTTQKKSVVFLFLGEVLRQVEISALFI